MFTIKTAGKTLQSLSTGVFLLVALALAATTTRATDLASASEAYTKGDYAAAFKGFRELAELGQPMAQFNLAVMYAKGQGARQSEIYAYAWASLAAKNGLSQAQPLVAVRNEKKAIEMADHLHWDLTPLDARLASYTARQPWYGTLLSF